MSAPAPGKRRVRKRDSERTRANILNVATQEFSQHGFSGARTETIARRAKCNIRLIYHHFKSKQGLYLAVIEAAYAQIRREEAELDFDLSDPVGALEKLLRFTIEYFERNAYFEGLLQAENLIQGRFVRRSRVVPESAVRLKSTLREIIEAGEARGVLRPGLDPVQLYVTITALSRFHRANAYSLSALLGEDLLSPTWREQWEAHAVRLLRAYLAAPANVTPARARAGKESA
ncbi:MAG: TetR/AcrR family transcriptional regulator [Gammaproteobacteria bacterium]